MTVTVCVPVWNGESFVSQTLASLREQAHADFRALVSIDRSDDESAAVCRAFAPDPRFEIIVQPERLGWIGNVNALLSRIETPLGCILPHDDVIAPDYLERLVGKLGDHPSAVLAFSDLETFGSREHVLVQPGLVGSQFQRIVACLVEHVAAVGWRGVFRSDVLARGRFHRDEPRADTLWLLELACEGDLVRVPEILYRKRLHPDSARKQPSWTVPSRQVNWIDHCVACYRVAMSAAEWTVPQKQEIAAAVLARALRFSDDSEGVPGTPAGSDRVVAYASHFLLRVSDEIPRGTTPPSDKAALRFRFDNQRKKRSRKRVRASSGTIGNRLAPKDLHL